MLAVAGIVAATVLLAAAAAWYAVAATAPTGFEELRASAERSAASPRGRPSLRTSSAPPAQDIAPRVRRGGKRSSQKQLDEAELEMVRMFAPWWGHVGQSGVRWADEPMLWPPSEARIAEAMRNGATWRESMLAKMPPARPEDEAAVLREALDRFEAQLQYEGNSPVVVLGGWENGTLALLSSARALAERDEQRFAALALRILQACDPEEILIHAHAMNHSRPGGMLVDGMRGMVIAACDEGLLGEESLAALAEAAARARLRPSAMDDLWVRYCADRTHRMQRDARMLRVTDTNMWGCFLDGAANRKVASMMMPVYDRSVERLAVAWASKNVAAIERCTEAEETLRRRLNLEGSAREHFDGGMLNDIRRGEHPLVDVSDWYGPSLFAMEARIAAERWKIARGGEMPRSLDDLVPDLLAPPDGISDAIRWDVRMIAQPQDEPAFVVVQFSAVLDTDGAREPNGAHHMTLWSGDAEVFDMLVEAVLGAEGSGGRSSENEP